MRMGMGGSRVMGDPMGGGDWLGGLCICWSFGV
jgi:hypothetical protein